MGINREGGRTHYGAGFIAQRQRDLCRRRRWVSERNPQIPGKPAIRVGKQGRVSSQDRRQYPYLQEIIPLMLAKRGTRVVAVELEEKRAEWQQRQATRLGLAVLPVVADAANLPFAPQSFARIASVSAIEHIPNDREVGSEIGRVLAADGIAAISVPYTFEERHSFFEGLKPFERISRNEFVQAGRGNLVRFYTDADLESHFAAPAHARIDAKSFFGRALLNDRYHETRLNRYWTRYVIKDLILTWFVYPFEELFLRKSEPFGVIFHLRKIK